jgi:Flp pilus assembly pilin Flp
VKESGAIPKPPLSFRLFHKGGKRRMEGAGVKLYLKMVAFSAWLKDEQGQDLVEYAAVIALVVLALVGGMNTLATGINTAMATVSTNINSVLS